MFDPFQVEGSDSGGSGLAQGSDPLPGETEQEYVARQRALQEEVCANDIEKILAGVSSLFLTCDHRPGEGEDAAEIRWLFGPVVGRGRRADARNRLRCELQCLITGWRN